MSNPGVLTLTEKRITHRRSFRVEDNLGESIHIHYNDIRLDLTIRDLLKLAEICDETIYDLVRAEGFNLDEYDEDFLVEYSGELIDLEKVQKDFVRLSELEIMTKSHGIPGRKKFSRSVASEILKDKKVTDNKYLPVLFNDDNVLLYGEKQAAQYLLDNKEQIEVLRLCFKGNKHSIPKNPGFDYLFHWDKKRLKNVLNNIRK